MRVNYFGTWKGRIQSVALSDSFTFMLEAAAAPAIISQVASPSLLSNSLYLSAFLVLSVWEKASDLSLKDTLTTCKFKNCAKENQKLLYGYERWKYMSEC